MMRKNLEAKRSKKSRAASADSPKHTASHSAVPMMAVSLNADYQRQLAPDRIARGIKRDARILKYAR